MASPQTPPVPSRQAILVRQMADGVLWTAVATGAQQLVNLAFFIVLARHLSPLEFGIMGMAVVFLDIVLVVGRAGLVEVLVQRAELDERTTSTAFWSSAALGVLGSVLLWFGAGAVSAFFHVPEVRWALQWLALVPAFAGLGIVHEALLRRQFGFRALALRSLAATLIGGGVAVAMAVSGYGLSALITHGIASAVLLTLMLWVFMRWRPSLQFDRGEFLRQFRMGMTVSAATLLGMGNQRIVDVVVGRALGPTPLGFLRIAWRGFETMLDLAMRPVVQVSFPLFSRLQHDAQGLRAAYVRLARMTALLIFPVFMGSVVIAPEIIRLAFGAQWAASVPLMQVLALSVVSMPMIYYKSNLLLAIGRATAVLWLNVLEFGLSLVIVVGACRYGVEGAAWGNVLRVVVVAVPILWALQYYAGISWRALLVAMLPATACTALMLAAAGATRLLAQAHVGPVVLVALVVGAGAVTYVAALRLLYRPLFLELLEALPGPVRRWLDGVAGWRAA